MFYLFLVLAIFSKEMGYIVPLIIVILDWYQFRVYRIKSKAIPIGLIVIATLGIRFLVLGSLIGGYGNAIHLNTNLLTLFKVPCVYLLKYITFFRYSQSTILSLLVICLLIGISTPYVKQLIKIKSKRPVVFIFLLFIATLLPVINLETTSLFAIQSDRYGYFNAVVFASVEMQAEELLNNIPLMDLIRMLIYLSQYQLRLKIEHSLFNSQCLFLHQDLIIHRGDKLYYKKLKLKNK